MTRLACTEQMIPGVVHLFGKVDHQRMLISLATYLCIKSQVSPRGINILGTV